MKTAGKRTRVLALLLAATGLADAAVDPRKVQVEWDASTLRLVAEHGTYARIIRLTSGVLACCYQQKGQSWVKRSRDDGRSWDEGRVATAYGQGIAANPELIQLQNGDLVLLYNERPADGKSPFAISSVVSRDEGLSWSAPRRIYDGGTRWEEGCWEPSALQFPDGEVQIYFANETPYADSNEQEISMISSRDPSKVWRVSFREQSRDGMPAPCLLGDGKTVAIAIEDNGLAGKMKPVILYSDTDRRWKEGVVGGTSPRRRAALAEPLAPSVYAGAPYLCQMPSGITLLSVQIGESGEESSMVVYVGDEMARGFANKSVPFALDEGVAGKWNSLFVKDRETVVAVSGTRIGGVYGIWTIDGKVRVRE